jgi:hypothetical protein
MTKSVEVVYCLPERPTSHRTARNAEPGDLVQQPLQQRGAHVRGLTRMTTDVALL